jgi:DNA-binding LacI/PurR family transcriptional regulator
MQERATIKDVADAARVSATTVSHVFSRKRHVSDATAARVRAAAERLGYAPNANALGLATGRSMTLAMHVSFEGSELVLNPFFTSMLPAMSSAALDRGYSFTILPSPVAEARPTLARLLAERRIDGAVLVDPDPETKLHLDLAEHFRPFVTTGRIPDLDSTNWVDNDLETASFAMLNHLAEQGYESPALVAVLGRQSFIADYVSSYQRWCDESAVEPLVLWAPALTEVDGYGVAEKALATARRPDALVCMHDRLAVGALRAAADLQIAVPETVGIAGMTDTVFATHVVPRLTSIHLFPERIGDAAVDMLIALIEERDVVSPVVVATEVVVRESTRRSPEPDQAAGTE